MKSSCWKQFVMRLFSSRIPSRRAIGRPSRRRRQLVSCAADIELLEARTVCSATPLLNDFDGDHRTDLATYRVTDGVWSILRSSTGTGQGVQWGGSDMVSVGGCDFDGDGRTDLAAYRVTDGVWSILRSSTGTPQAVQWGGSDMVPVGGCDFDGDGRTDLAAYRVTDGVWSILRSSTGTPQGVQWGGSDMVPVGGCDFDGDGKTDLAAYRVTDGVWSILRSSTGTGQGVQWGGSDMVPVGGVDFDGDGRTDLAAYRVTDGVWSIRTSSGVGGGGIQWGGADQIPVGGVDIDGDHRTDLAAYRVTDGVWSILRSSTGTPQGVQWGGADQRPAQFVASTPMLRAADVSVVEGNSGVQQLIYTITLSEPTDRNVSVDYSTRPNRATPEVDYVSQRGTIVFHPGEMTKTVSVAIKGDTNYELDEFVILDLTNANGALLTRNSIQGTIQSDDIPVLTAADVGVPEGNTAVRQMVFTFTLSAANEQAVTVDYATRPLRATPEVDYVSQRGTIVFNPGETTKTVTIGIQGDTNAELNEFVILDLTNANGVTLPRTAIFGTIQNDDVPILSAADVGVREGNSGRQPMVFTFTLSGPVEQAVSVDYGTRPHVATPDVDYVSQRGTIVFAPGETTKTVTVEVLGDREIEANEFVILDLTNSSGATLARTSIWGTIQNDDVPLNPEIEVVGLRDGQSEVVSFGTVNVGATFPARTLTVNNVGTAPLRLFDRVIVPAGFVVSGASPTSLAPGGTLQFTISLRTNQAGTFAGEFSFSNNDSDEGPFNFRLTGTVQAAAGPEITVLVNGSSIQDGQSSAISFGQQQQGTAQSQVTFIIRNDGRQTLQLGTPTVPSGFAIVQAPQRTVGAGRQTTMVVAMRTNQSGTFRGEIVLTNNDSDENPFNIPVEGRVIEPPRAPEIAVIVSGRELAVGETGNLNFGATFTNLVPARREVQIRNTGDDVLVLSNVQVTGNFSTSSPRELRLQPGESRTISVTLGNTLGTQRGSLTFRSNDSDESAVSISLLGRVLSPPVTVSGNPIRVDISGTYTLILDNNVVKVEIDPPHERVPFGTSYVVTVTSRNGSQSRFNLDGNLHTLRVLGSGSRTASIENWTSVTVRTT